MIYKDAELSIAFEGLFCLKSASELQMLRPASALYRVVTAFSKSSYIEGQTTVVERKSLVSWSADDEQPVISIFVCIV